MSLVVGSEGESGLIGALLVPRNLLARKAGTATAILELPVSPARDLLDRAILAD